MASELPPPKYTDNEEDRFPDETEEKGRLLNPHLSGEYLDLKRLNSGKRAWYLTALTFSLLIFSLVINVLQWQADKRCIFPTDLPDSRGAIEYEQRTFTGSLTYDPERHEIVRVKDAEVEFFGPPSEEIDEAWHELLRERIPPMTDEEAAPFLPELHRLPPTGLYHFEPDMFHSLHCVNALRTTLSKSLYPNSTYESHDHHAHGLPPSWNTDHLEHCMDRIRQTIMCSGDMAPGPIYYWDDARLGLGVSGVHTCRKFQPIRDWLDVRASRGPTLE